MSHSISLYFPNLIHFLGGKSILVGLVMATKQLFSTTVGSTTNINIAVKLSLQNFHNFQRNPEQIASEIKPFAY